MKKYEIKTLEDYKKYYDKASRDDILNDTYIDYLNFMKILTETEKWEDLKKLKMYDNIILYDELSIKEHRTIINNLIKNQKYLKNKIEQLEKSLKEGK